MISLRPPERLYAPYMRIYAHIVSIYAPKIVKRAYRHHKVTQCGRIHVESVDDLREVGNACRVLLV